MIKLIGESQYGRKLLVLGLSDENVRRLTSGDPILVRGHELRLMGLPDFDISIVHGETEDAIIERFRNLGVGVHDTTEGTGQ